MIESCIDPRSEYNLSKEQCDENIRAIYDIAKSVQGKKKSHLCGTLDFYCR